MVMEEKEEKEGEKRDVLFLYSELLKLCSPRKTNVINRTMKFGLSSDCIKAVHNDIFHITQSFKSIWGVN